MSLIIDYLEFTRNLKFGPKTIVGSKSLFFLQDSLISADFYKLQDRQDSLISADVYKLQDRQDLPCQSLSDMRTPAD